MSKKMYEENSIKAIAESIRKKNGGTATYKVSDMAVAIEALPSQDAITHAAIPEYVKAAALEVAKKVRALQNDSTITFLAMSDAHQLDTSADINTGNLHAGMAAKVLAYALPQIDFCCYLGDYTAGSSTTTLAEGRTHFAEINADIDEAFSGIPQFRTLGNHDSLQYSKSQNGSVLSATELYSLCGKYNSGATMGSTTQGYCYRDFTAKKLRVICLNTAEASEKEYVSDAQKLWFSNTLKAVGAKSGWNVLILSHHPLDWGGVCILSNIVKAYGDGSSITVSSGNTVNFSGSNSAKIIAAVHGHVHCFKTAKLNYIANSVGTEYDVYRIATPNMCFQRNNEYGQNGTTEYYGIEFGETTTYGKTAGTANDTAFVVNVVDTVNRVFHSICYGAGYDRIISYGKELVITQQPKDFEVVEGTAVTETIIASGEGVTYAWQFSPDNGTNWLSISNLGLDATQSSFTIPAESVTTSVNGYKVRCIVSDGAGKSLTSSVATLTVTAASTVTNLVPTLLDLASASGVFNGTGYRDGAYLSTASPYYNTDASRVTTGLLPYTKDTQKPIYIKGATYGTDSHDRIGYRSSSHPSNGIYSTCSLGTGWCNTCFTITQLGSNYFMLTPKSADVINSTLPGMKHLAFSFVGKGSDLIITIDEPIE